MKLHYLAGAALALALAACGGKTVSNTSTTNTTTTANTTVVAPAPAAAPTEAAGDETPTATVNGGANQDFEILNKTGHIVVAFNVSPTDENEWGPDILGRDVLNDGESAKITFPHDADKCMWDLRATYDDKDTTEMKGVNLCQIGTVTLNP